MKLDPVALELLTALAQYSTYDEVLVANKLFCLQGPWVSVEKANGIIWWPKRALPDNHRNIASIRPTGILCVLIDGQPAWCDICNLPAFLAKVRS